MSAYTKSVKRPIANLSDSSDSDSDVKTVKKIKRPDYNELFSLKLSPYNKFHIALTNGKTDGDNILFVNIRNGYSVYGAGKGLVLSYEEIAHLLTNLDYNEPLPKFKNNNVKLIGKPKHGKYELTRIKGDKKISLALPLTVMVGFLRVLPCIKYLMETIRKQNHEESDRAFEKFLASLQHIVMIYIKQMGKNAADFDKADLRKMYWIYAGLAAIFNVPALDNPFEPEHLHNILHVSVDPAMIAPITDIIDYVILKNLI